MRRKPSKSTSSASGGVGLEWGQWAASGEGAGSPGPAWCTCTLSACPAHASTQSTTLQPPSLLHYPSPTHLRIPPPPAHPPRHSPPPQQAACRAACQSATPPTAARRCRRPAPQTRGERTPATGPCVQEGSGGDEACMLRCAARRCAASKWVLYALLPADIARPAPCSCPQPPPVVLLQRPPVHLRRHKLGRRHLAGAREQPRNVRYSMDCQVRRHVRR